MRTKDTNRYEGLLFVNKPRGVTSHDVVDEVRRRLGMKRVGHAGTLDPLAEGLLIILVGRYTKFFPKFVAFDKEYLGTLRLGEVTTTGDSEGELVRASPLAGVDDGRIKEAFRSFIGEIEQVPPMVSAIRKHGRRLYELARKGIVVNRKARKITIYKLDVLQIHLPYVSFYVRCSKGTYVRKLAEDVGERLGCGAHITTIKRISIGPFKLEEAVSLEEINETHLKKISLW